MFLFYCAFVYMGLYVCWCSAVPSICLHLVRAKYSLYPLLISMFFKKQEAGPSVRRWKPLEPCPVLPPWCIYTVASQAFTVTERERRKEGSTGKASFPDFFSRHKKCCQLTAPERAIVAINYGRHTTTFWISSACCTAGIRNAFLSSSGSEIW